MIPKFQGLVGRLGFHGTSRDQLKMITRAVAPTALSYNA